jgi:hypothetical protein
VAETITVDGGRLRAGAASARQWVEQFEASSAGGAARAALVHGEDELSGSRAAPAIAMVAGALDAVAAQVITALHGLAAGLDTTAAAFRQADVVAGVAAERLADAGHGEGAP